MVQIVARVVDAPCMVIGAALDAAVSLVSERTEQAVLERLVDVTRSLTCAGHGVALLIGPDGQPSALAHQGMTSGQIGALPRLLRPVGLVGVVLRGEVVRVPDLGAHPEAVGFPEGHVPMAALLGVPVAVDGRVVGALCLTRAPGQGVFTAEDELTALSAARLAGGVLQAQRQQVAGEALLDGLRPVQDREDDTLAVPGPQSPVIRQLLASARQVLKVDLALLSRIEDGRQTFTHTDGALPVAGEPEGFRVPEGTEIPTSEGYCALLLEGAIPAAVPDVAGHPVLGARGLTSLLGLGSYCGVPVRLPDGSLYGTLCGLDGSAGQAPSPGQVLAMQVLAELIGARLGREQARAARLRAAVEQFTPLLDGRRRTIVLQPIVEIATGRTVGFEALSRFTEGTGAPRRPDQVFAEAHELGLGVQLEQAAARDALALLPRLPAGTYLSVNLSPQAVLHSGSDDLLSAALTSAGAGRVVLELTEHEHVPDYPGLLLTMARLRERGLRLAVDDTGSGFASLQHVLRLRPEIIKLDIAFVRDVHRDPARRAAARAMIAFAADLDATLVAEGIETAAELEQLRILGAPYGQGYHFAAPQPVEQALQQQNSPARTLPRQDRRPGVPAV